MLLELQILGDFRISRPGLSLVVLRKRLYTSYRPMPKQNLFNEKAPDKFPGGPLKEFKPKSGERYGWMISSATKKAGSKYTVNERSNVSEFVWP